MIYSEKLKNPLWQRKRLFILTRDNFTCQKCKDDQNTVHVHHRHYITGREPWDYPDQLLITLCEKCHKEEETAKVKASEILNSLHQWGYFNTEIIDTLNKMIEVKINDSNIPYAKSDIKRLD